MKKILLGLTLSSALILGACSDKNEAIVSYNGGEITKEELSDYLFEYFADDALQSFVIEKILLENYKGNIDDIKKKAKEELQNLGDKEAIKKYLDSNDFISEEEYYESYVIGYLQKALMLEKYQFSEEELKTEKEAFKTDVKVNAILAENKAAAEKAIERIKAGEDFAVVAKELSMEINIFENGDYGYLTYDQTEIDPVVFETAHKTQVNNVSAPVASTYYEGYYYIVKPLEFVQYSEEEIDLFIKEKILADNSNEDTAYEMYTLLMEDYKVNLLDDNYRSPYIFK